MVTFGIALLSLLLSGLAAFFGIWGISNLRNRREAQAEEKQDMAWAEKVHEISVDKQLGETSEIDLTELHQRLALEDIEIAVTKRARRVVDEAVHTLTDDRAWAAYMENHKTLEFKVYV